MPITKASGQAVAPAAKGDLVVGSATNDAAVLAVGSANQVLTVDSSTTTGLKWATPSSGAMTQLATGTLSGSQVDISGISGAYRSLQLQISQMRPTNNGGVLRVRVNDDASGNTYRTIQAFFISNVNADSSNYDIGDVNNSSVSQGLIIMNWYEYANTNIWKIGDWCWIGNNSTTSTNFGFYNGFNVFKSTSAITKINLFLNPGGDFAGGTYTLYGVK